MYRGTISPKLRGSKALSQELSATDSVRLVGTFEAAEALGISRQAISNLKARDPTFPRPVAELHMGPVWYLGPLWTWYRERMKRKALR